MKKLKKDREERLIFYTFLSAHWASIKTINLIESVFYDSESTKLTREALWLKKNNYLVFKLFFLVAYSKNWNWSKDI